MPHRETVSVATAQEVARNFLKVVKTTTKEEC